MDWPIHTHTVMTVAQGQISGFEAKCRFAWRRVDFFDLNGTVASPRRVGLF
jgi:hypothetical protein